ncbi:Smr/MutS family protein [Myxococcus sp. CA051A]|uniref:DNA mismatch repair protein MutS n=1 Tax=Myxococcus llanfairpwllgwyngyllgogerychwyrndrobwllllantysiliogogogochensis TaxID=2590453 RepID=A0A540WK76_9BACT|nr:MULTISPECIES: Smr/MutS family protein [Myxococcus]NTX03602.1 Smr/MutS family protein [Myxococcus sp. CA040A]NTX14234.1 Smr/MutS family protein [Myxococcus sp. CA056]NTX35369.1 Smr/MutS family protein [Myxococcus sp. CA033]NTX52012.1 Smr/MutS family protein [Myxococcus sp. CA039A]NTX62216.1 Smr/MutS family protein [Myxococcus sp. CA051A]
MSSQKKSPPKKKDEAFHNNPFKGAIKSIQDQEKKEAQARAASEAEKRKPAAAPVRAKAKPTRESAEDDAALFYSAMDGVAQITNRGEAPKSNPRLPELIDENAEALAQLSELVAGQGDFDISSGADEFLEGTSPGVDRNLLRALRRGDFSIQGQLDLHGKTQPEAKAALERFLSDSRRARHRCVLIVHGRGLHSKDQMPVLKELMKSWLSQKRIGGLVLAFATARPQDGGTGAVYVLLRR